MIPSGPVNSQKRTVVLRVANCEPCRLEIGRRASALGDAPVSIAMWRFMIDFYAHSWHTLEHAVPIRS